MLFSEKLFYNDQCWNFENNTENISTQSFFFKKKLSALKKQNNQTLVSCTDVAQVSYIRSFHKGSYKAGVDLVVNAVWWRAHSKKQSKGFWLLAIA